MPEIPIPKIVHIFSNTTSSQLHIFVDASMAAMAAVAYLRTTNSQATRSQACFLMGKCKVAPIKQLSVPKMELEAAVIGVRLLQLIQREMTMTIDHNFLWSDIQVVFDWIASNKKQNVLFQTDYKKFTKVLYSSNSITSQIISIPPITELAVLRQTKLKRND